MRRLNIQKFEKIGVVMAVISSVWTSRFERHGIAHISGMKRLESLNLC